jgi:WD40 repeat protein
VDRSTFLVRASDGKRVHQFGAKRRLSAHPSILGTILTASNAVWLVYGPRTAISADGTYVVTADDIRGSVTVWNARTGKRIWTRYVSGPEAAFVDLGPKSSWVAVPDIDGVSLFDQRTGNRLDPLSEGRAWPFAAAASADGRYLVTAEWDEGVSGGTLRVWDVRLRRVALKIHSRSHRIPVVAIDRAGRFAAGGALDGTVRIWRISDRRRTATLRPRERLRALAFAPDGALIATATGSDFVEIWNVLDGTRVVTLKGHRGAINSVEFSRPDGKLVVTASDDGTVKVWRVSDGSPLATFREGRPGRALDATFDRKGRRIVVGASDGSSDVYACPLCGGEQELLAFARQQAPRVP